MRARLATLLILVTGAVLSCGSPRAVAEPKLYWTEEGSIKRANLDGTGVQAVIQTGEDFAYIAAGRSSKELYYAIGSPTPQLWSADLDGQHRELLATFDTANYVRGLAFEQDSRKLYWTSFHGYRAGNGKVRSADADGSNVRDVLALTDGYPYGMAIDHAANRMFWVNYEQRTIESAKLDGTSRQVVGQEVSFTTQLALDPAANKLYWTDVDDLKIHWSNYDGSESAVIASPGSPYSAYDSGIAVDHPSRSLFWSDTATDRIFRADLDGSNATAIISRGLQNPGSMVVINNPDPTSGLFVLLLAAGAPMTRRRGR